MGLLNMSNILCVITKPPNMLMKETKAAAAASVWTLYGIDHQISVQYSYTLQYSISKTNYLLSYSSFHEIIFDLILK